MLLTLRYVGPPVADGAPHTVQTARTAMLWGRGRYDTDQLRRRALEGSLGVEVVTFDSAELARDPFASANRVLVELRDHATDADPVDNPRTGD